MNYMNEKEQSFVLGDMEVFNEFDMSHFISNTKTAITNKAETVNVNLKFDYYSNTLEKAMKSFSDISLEKDSMKEFLVKFDDYNKLETSNTLVRDIELAENTVIKPQYFHQYIELVTKTIEDFLNDKIDFAQASRLMTNEIPVKVEKQIVKTNLPYGITSKELRKETTVNAPFVKADGKFIKEKVIPFVTRYNKLKEETKTEADATLSAIKETEQSIKGMLEVLNKIRIEGELSSEKLVEVNQLAYNSIRGVISVVSFVSFMLIHKLNVISTNVITCNKLYVDVFNTVNTNENVTEDLIVNVDEVSLGTELLEGKSTALTILSNRIYEYNTQMLNVNTDRDEINHDELDVVETLYDEVMKAYELINGGIHSINTEIHKDNVLVFNDITSISGLNINLCDRFREVINAINDMSMYNVDTCANSMDIDMYTRMLDEVNKYSDRMDKIAAICNRVIVTIAKLQEDISNNVNNEFKDMETITELRVFLKSVRDQYIDMTNSIANNFMKRLKEIGNRLNILNSYNDESNVKSNDVETSEEDSVIEIDDFDEEVSESVFDIIVESKESEYMDTFKELQKSFIREKALITEGVITVFEAEQPAQGTNNTNAQQNTNTNNGTNNANTNDAKPKVIDNSGNNNNTSTNNTNNQNQNSENNSTSLNSLIETVKNVWTKIVETLRNSSKKKAAHNQKFIESNKQALLDRSYNNVAIEVVPYNNKPIDGIISDLNKLASNVSSGMLTAQVIQGFNSKQDVVAKLLPFISGVNAEEDIKTQVYNFYAMGNTKTAPKTTTIANGQLKSLVANEMIPYCENYYSQTLETLIKVSMDIQNKLTDTIEKLNTGAPQNGNTNNVKESVDIFTEADENKNTETSMKSKANWAVDITRAYTNALTSVCDKRCNDYLSILNSLKPATQTTTTAKVTDGNDAENQPNNNTNNTNTNV